MSSTARPAATVRRPRSASSSLARRPRRGSSGRRELLGELLDEAGDGHGGAGERRPCSTVLGALLHAVEVQRVADGVGELVDALLEHRASGGDEVGVALDVLERRDAGRRACSHWRACSSGQAAALGERVDHRVEAAGGGAREQAAAGVGDGDVGEAGDVDVEHGAASALRSASARTMPNADRSMPSTCRPASRAAPASCSTISRRTATTTTRVRVLAGRRLDGAERLPVEDGLVHRHRDVVGRLHLDGGGERLLVLQRRQVERADDDALVGDAEAHALRAARARRRRSSAPPPGRGRRRPRRRAGCRGAGGRRRRA